MTEDTADAARHLLHTGQVAGLVLLPGAAYSGGEWGDLVE